MSQFICERCKHDTNCEDHKGHTVNIEQCGDFEKAIRHLVMVEVEVNPDRLEPDETIEDYIEREIAWSSESFYYQRILKIEEVK